MIDASKACLIQCLMIMHNDEYDQGSNCFLTSRMLHFQPGGARHAAGGARARQPGVLARQGWPSATGRSPWVL